MNAVVAVMLSCANEVMGVLAAYDLPTMVLERLTDGMAVITPGDRSDGVGLLLSMRPKGLPLSCIVLNGGFQTRRRRPGFLACDCGYLSSPPRWAPTTPPVLPRRPAGW